MLHVALGGFLGMVASMKAVTVRDVGMLHRLLVCAALIVLCGLFVVTGRVLEMLGGLLAVLCSLLGHTRCHGLRARTGPQRKRVEGARRSRVSSRFPLVRSTVSLSSHATIPLQSDGFALTERPGHGAIIARAAAQAHSPHQMRHLDLTRG